MVVSEQLFRDMPVGRLFLTAALPGAFGMLVSSIYGLLDGIFVGTFIGETAFAAINLAMPFVIVNFAFGDLIGVGSAVLISHARGAGETARANNLFTCACIMNVVCGLIVGLTFLFLAPHIMAWMGAEGELARQGALYLRVYSVFLPLTSICYAADNYLRICGQISRSMWANVLMAATGAAIEFLLLGVFHLGVGAAALSFCLAMVAAVTVSLWPFFQGRLELTFCRPRFSGALVREVVADGAPAFLENVAGRIASVVLNAALLAEGGEEAVSIFGVLMFMDGVLVPLIYGMVDSLQPAVGFNWGARDISRVRAIERWCFAVACGMSLVFFVLARLFAPQVVHLFVPAAEGAFLDEATGALKLFSLSFIVRWLPFCVQAYMVAVGCPRFATIVSLSSALVFPLVVLVALRPLGLMGLWLNMPVSSVAAMVLALMVLRIFRRSPELYMGAAAQGKGAGDGEA